MTLGMKEKKTVKFMLVDGQNLIFGMINDIFLVDREGKKEPMTINFMLFDENYIQVFHVVGVCNEMSDEVSCQRYKDEFC